MIKTLSKSTTIMFLFDLIILSSVSNCTWSFCVDHSIHTSRVLAVALIVIAGLFSLFLKGQYKIREHNITFWNIYRLFEGVVMAHIPTAILLFFFIDKISLLKFLGINIIAVYALLGIYRLFFHCYLFELKKVKKVLLVGANERTKAIADVIKNKDALKMDVVGIIKSAEADKMIAQLDSKTFHFDLTKEDIKEFEERIEEESNFTYQGVEIFEDGKNIHNICEKTDADMVIFSYPSGLSSAVPNKIKEYSMPEFYEMATGRCYIDEDTLADFAYNFRNKPKEIYDIWKRRLDILCSSVILIVTLPITAYVAIRVKLTDGKSPFYTQDRVGKDGKIFKAYKLRTMYDNNFVPKDNKKVGYVENQDEDDRVIPWCKFVRKARFDEIPQMVNILKGEMSIVGPRCEWKEVADVYQQEIQGYPFRMLVKTAWTGWAQINQGYCFASDNEAIKLSYDLYYIKHRNIFWDIAILVKAVFLAVGGRHD